MLAWYVIGVREYVDAGKSPFSKWLRGLNVQARSEGYNSIGKDRRWQSLERQARCQGCFGIQDRFRPGYRIYFGRDGDRLVILLAGGTKKRQQADIESAKAHWANYNRRRK
jgi:putative addiction module killer protein